MATYRHRIVIAQPCANAPPTFVDGLQVTESVASAAIELVSGHVPVLVGIDVAELLERIRGVPVRCGDLVVGEARPCKGCGGLEYRGGGAGGPPHPRLPADTGKAAPGLAGVAGDDQIR